MHRIHCVDCFTSLDLFSCYSAIRSRGTSKHGSQWAFECLQATKDFLFISVLLMIQSQHLPETQLNKLLKGSPSNHLEFQQTTSQHCRNKYSYNVNSHETSRAQLTFFINMSRKLTSVFLPCLLKYASFKVKKCPTDLILLAADRRSYTSKRRGGKKFKLSLTFSRGPNSLAHENKQTNQQNKNNKSTQQAAAKANRRRDNKDLEGKAFLLQ